MSEARSLAVWLQALGPVRMHVDARERLRIVLGAGLGITLAAWLTHLAGGLGDAVWIVAPLGASAVLVFGVPASPLAQPWAVVAGNTASALVGIACVHWALWVGASPAVATGAAVALAIGAMFVLRCLHPPGGAMAMTMALAHTADWQFAFFPVLLNSLLLVAAGIAYNSATRRRYPHAQTVAPAPAALQDGTERGIRRIDLDAALADYNQVMDLPEDDLQALLQGAEMHAYRRHLGELRCADVMTREPVTVQFGTLLEEAWALLRQRRIKALPVVDRVGRVVGILTLADFLREADLDLHHHGFDAKLRHLVRRSGLTHSNKPEVVGQIMTRQVRVASVERPVSELVPLFASTGHHHIPVIGAEGRIVGMLTQSDVVAALCAPIQNP